MAESSKIAETSLKWSRKCHQVETLAQLHLLVTNALLKMGFCQKEDEISGGTTKTRDGVRELLDAVGKGEERWKDNRDVLSPLKLVESMKG